MARPQAEGIKGAAAGDAPGVVLDALATAGAPVIVPGGEFLLCELTSVVRRHRRRHRRHRRHRRVDLRAGELR